jgi:N-acetylneuraminate lyase
VVEHTEGLVAAPFTPLHEDRSLNLEPIGPYAALLHRSGVVGAFVCGSTGEGVSLTTEERMRVAERWAADAPSGLKVIVHVGHTSIGDCRALAAHAQRIGAWATGAMAPYYFKPRTVEALAAFCAEVASAQDLPLYYYHIPVLTGVDLPMIDFLQAAADRVPNLAGIKFTHPNLMDYSLCRAFDGGRFDMLFGTDEMLLPALSMGARGAIGSTYNFAAPLYRRIIEAFGSGDIPTARALQMKSIELIRFVASVAGSYHTAAKAIMGLLGVPCGPLRTPLPNITDEQLRALREGLERIGFFEYCCR